MKRGSVLMRLLIALSAVVAAGVAVVALQPSDFRVTRSGRISAPQGTVFAQVNDLHKWKDWSPWAKLDPAARESFEGPPAGAGAVFRWAGNSDVGEGSMTIVESRPNEFIRFRLDFVKPFKGTSTAEFAFQGAGDQTVVNWSMFGSNNFAAKAVGLVMDCEKMVGGQFEKGLAQLKSVSEAAAKP